MRKALFIVGPTASGKTELGLKVASQFNGALVSADSVQVYKGLDVVSGKDLPKEKRFRIYDLGYNNKKFESGFYTIDNVKVHLLDVVSPTYSFNVADFVNIAIPTICEISNNNFLPIIVGGTGFYIKALLDGVGTVKIPPNEELRAILENKTVEELSNLLKKQNLRKYASMNDSDKKNKRRLIRAIEIAEYQAANQLYSSSEVEKSENSSSYFASLSRTISKLEGYDILMIGLFADRQVLKQRIDARVDERIEQGAFFEAENLFKNYKNLSSSVKNANGYKQLFEFLQGKIRQDAAVDKWKKAEYLNAKKQMTWFGKDKRIEWFDIESDNFLQNINDRLSYFLS